MEIVMEEAAQLPFDQKCPVDVAPLLRELQAEGPIHPVKTMVGDPAWLVVSHAEVRRLMDDERLGMSHPNPESAARSDASALLGGPTGDFDTEPFVRKAFRDLLQPHFGPKHMRPMKPRVEELTSRLLDDLEQHGSPADLHAELALPLPILVICELLGVPYEDRDEFRGWSADISSTQDRARSENGLMRMYEYGEKLVEKKRREPEDDVISRFCEVPGISNTDIAGLAMGLLFAGHDTTVLQIGVSALLLLADREQWQAVVDRPALLSNAIDETLRTARRTGGGRVPRYARTDLEVNGIAIKKGDLVLLDVCGANHDPAVFDDPDRVDVTRPVGGHLSFGHGARYCPGAPLARIELEAVFSQLIARFPTMRLAVPVEEIKAHRDTLVGGLVELPVQW
jgi:pentalenolactone synthase